MCPPDDVPYSKDRNASRLLIFGSCTCDSVISYVIAIMTIKLLLKGVLNSNFLPINFELRKN